MSNETDLHSLLVQGSHILANEGVMDGFGHISARHPDNANHFLISCSRSPELVSLDDVMELGSDGEPVDPNESRKPFLERFIHAAIYAARPDVNSVVHHHAKELVAVGISETGLRPVMHMAGAMGATVPTWDIRDKFGDTNLLVTNMDHGHDLARCLDSNSAALMRGHGAVVAKASVQETVLTAIFMHVNAQIMVQAAPFGEIKYLSDGEAELSVECLLGPIPFQRAWEYYSRRITGD
jgi:HCOMODA/2-hydroxy-3-carboxy-muconic semialdehyde decarboxylase